jgi:methyl-accepting chemotaxis protein
MFSSLTIRTKLLAILAATAVLSAGVSSYIGYQTAQQALEEQSFNKLTAVREMKANQIEGYFRQINDQILTLSEDRMIIDAMKDFRAAFASIDRELAIPREALASNDQQLRLYYQNEYLARLNPNLSHPAVVSDYWPQELPTRTLQDLYIASNPCPTGSKQLLDAASDGSTYSQTHQQYHPLIRNFLERFGYYDIFLVDPKTGHIVYSVYKEVDFATSLLTGPYRDTNFARAFRESRASDSKDFVRLVDFAHYHPSYNAEASFIASPIFDGTEKVGVLLFQMPVDRINDIMTSGEHWSDVGLGDSGETYLVGDDYTLRNQSRFLIEDRENYLQAIRTGGTPASVVKKIANLGSSIGLQEVRTEGAEAALRGETGTRIFPDYRGVPVLSAYKPLEIRDVRWVIMSEIDEAEAFRPTADLRNRVLVCLAVLVAVILLVAAAFARSLTQPLKILADRAADLASGDLTAEIETSRSDEIGDLAKSFNAMRESLSQLIDRQASVIDALSSPLIPLHDQVMLMPLIGEFDERRVERVRTSLVEGIHASGTKVVILDLTGVPTMGESVSIGLVRVAKSARLLGAQVVITGVQANVARDLAELDLHLDGIITQTDLQSGIDFALRNVEGIR